MRITYISWAPYCSRSDNTARELGGTSHMVYLERFGSHAATVAFKYLGQAAQTWRILRNERPDAVFVMVPPVFAAMAVSAWCRLARVPFVMDTHTAAMLHPRWRRLQWLHYRMCRRAATSIVTNEHLAALVTAAGARATIVRDVPVVFPRMERFPRESAFTVAVVCSFNYDEPVAEIVQAAAALPDVRFLVTGNAKRLDPAVARALPPNVTLTGFLSTEAYGGLLHDADAVLTLTTRDHTMLRGAYEAIYQETPVIVSDWPLLRAAFDRGALHVDNSPAQIGAAVRRMAGEHAAFKAGAAALRRKKLEQWQESKRAILACLDEVASGRPAEATGRSSA
jgi:glycosyltransferase involved in cell wall biosynthesis